MPHYDYEVQPGKRSNTLYCFSPPIMAATAVVETSLMLYTLVRYKMNSITRLVAAMLGFLALFQISEYNVCGRFGVDAVTWSRIGYVAITLLPPMGLHLMTKISKQQLRGLVLFAYATSALWIGTFLFSSSAFSGYECTGNYVIFQLTHRYGGMYGTYYYFWLFITMILAVHYRVTVSDKARRGLDGLVFGYLTFLLPTIVINTISPATLDGVPSIMCGFAVLFALILAFVILPNTDSVKRNRR